MSRCRAAMRGLSIALVLGSSLPATTGMQPTATTAESGRQEAVETVLVNRELLLDFRTFSELHNQAVRGVQNALRRQVNTAIAINRRLAEQKADDWDDPRLRRAVKKFVVSGGDPSLLSRLIQAKVFPPDELPVAQGVLDYAYGRLDRAAEHLAGIEARSLEPGIAGHVALVQAILAQERDWQRVIELCDEVRVLAPGTGIEEAALRLALNTAIATGDLPGFERLMRLYLQRFPNSVYAGSMHVRMAGVVALLSDQTDEHARNKMVHLTAIVPQELRANFLGAVANAAIRSGRIMVAEVAARSALERMAPDRPSQRAALLAIEGAALIVGPQRADGVQRLEQAKALSPDPETAELIAAAQKLIDIIVSPSPRGTSAPVTHNDQSAEIDKHAAGSLSPTLDRSTALVAKVAARMAKVDELVNERTDDTAKAISP